MSVRSAQSLGGLPGGDRRHRSPTPTPSWQQAYPGEDGRRQPVHTVYVPADRYTAELPRQWGDAALALVEEHGGMTALCAELGLDPSSPRRWPSGSPPSCGLEPIEDLRLDFEDGYGDRGEQTEDADAVRVAGAAGRRAGRRGGARRSSGSASSASRRRPAAAASVPSTCSSPPWWTGWVSCPRPGADLAQGEHGQPGRGHGRGLPAP